MTERQVHPSPLSAGLNKVRWDTYDFIDLGASQGGSLKACSDRFGAAAGIGVDLDPEKAKRSRKAGFDVVVGDARHLDASNVVRFVSALDFLEHLPHLNAVEEVLAAAARAATDFLYIGHPSFEGEHYLRSLDVTQYWHNWSGHKAHITVSDYCTIFARLGLHTYSIEYVDQVTTSDHYSILPHGLPQNQSRYDPATHGPRPDLSFDEAIWRSQHIFVALRPFSPDDWASIVGRSR